MFFSLILVTLSDVDVLWSYLYLTQKPSVNAAQLQQHQGPAESTRLALRYQGCFSPSL